MLERIICIMIGYICGLLQTSYLYGRMNHMDIREHGSGNAGTTNALRTLGKKAGLITFLGDFLKPMLAMLIVSLIYKNRLDGSEGMSMLLLQIYAGVGAVLGHIFPCYLGFRGGKGIATVAGMSSLFCFLTGCWYVVPVMMAVFVAAVALTRYVSLGSIVIVTIYYIWIIILGQTGTFVLPQSELYEVYILMGIYSAITVWKHHTNIKRLIDGTENKIFQKKEN